MRDEAVKNSTFDLDHELPAMNANDESPAHASFSTRPRAGFVDTVRRDSTSAGDEVSRLRDQLGRMQADFENARKRALKEQRDFQDYAVFETVQSLLPVLDSFERALRSFPPENAKNRAGLELIYKQLSDVLSKAGVRPIPAQGEWFNPEIHQAIRVVDTRSVEEGRIIEELERGYRFKDRLLRPAMVAVARRPALESPF